MTNYVVEGWHKGCRVEKGIFGTVHIASMIQAEINTSTVTSYDVISESQRTSAASAIGKAAVGAFVAGPVGLVAAAGAKKVGSYRIALQFKNGKSSIIEVNDELYAVVIKELMKRERQELQPASSPKVKKKEDRSYKPPKAKTPSKTASGPVVYSQPGVTNQSYSGPGGFEQSVEVDEPLDETPPARTLDYEMQSEALKRFKELLDMGAITQEEFEAKKKQILGL